MNRTVLNAVLAVVVLGLVAAVWFSREKEEKGPPLTALKSADIRDIRIDHPGSPLIHLVKENGRWQLTEPVRSDVDAIELDGILSIAELETKLTLDATVKPADLKLDPPEYTVTLNDQKIGIGDVEPLNYRRYVSVGGKVVLVDDPPSTALDADYSDLIDKAPIQGGVKIAKVVLPKLTVARSADGKSIMLTPDDPDAGADRRQRFMDAWATARALWMAAEPPEGSQGEAVTVVLEDGRELHFIVAQRDPQLILARPDLKVRYTLSKALAEEILQVPPAPAPAPPTDAPGATPDELQE